MGRLASIRFSTREGEKGVGRQRKVRGRKRSVETEKRPGVLLTVRSRLDLRSSFCLSFSELLLSFFFRAPFVFLFQSFFCLSFSELLLSFFFRAPFVFLFQSSFCLSFSYQSVRRWVVSQPVTHSLTESICRSIYQPINSKWYKTWPELFNQSINMARTLQSIYQSLNQSIHLSLNQTEMRSNITRTLPALTQPLIRSMTE